jgi:hypothetical protein
MGSLLASGLGWWAVGGSGGLHGWIGQERGAFLCTRQNLARRDRRGLFSIHKNMGSLLNRRPEKETLLRTAARTAFSPRTK